MQIDKSKITANEINYLKNILSTHPGQVPIYFRVLMNGKDAINMISKKVKISVNLVLLDELVKILSIDNVGIKIKFNRKKQIKKNHYVY